jgi:hypothetical protein
MFGHSSQDVSLDAVVDVEVVVGSDPSKHLPLLILLLKNGRFSALE